MTAVLRINLPAAPDVGVEWMARAVCRDEDPELFHPVDESGHSPTSRAQVADAKAVCALCPVVPDCYTYAVRIGADHGIWAGMTSPERRKARRRMPVVIAVRCPACDTEFEGSATSRYCSAGCARRALNRGGSREPRSAYPWNGDEIATLRRLHDLGETDMAIATQLGRSMRAVRTKRQQLRMLRTEVTP